MINSAYNSRQLIIKHSRPREKNNIRNCRLLFSWLLIFLLKPDMTLSDLCLVLPEFSYFSLLQNNGVQRSRIPTFHEQTIHPLEIIMMNSQQPATVYPGGET